tara:strand:- start:1179 stop:1610 length:432 start_codon:yes stop_codon:yes gene_type:complete
MLEFWSIWNFSWWGLSQLKILKLDYALTTSIIGTSIMGGFLIHIYPRKLKINYNNERIEIPYKYSFWIDIIGHQLPLIILYNQRNQIGKKCGKNIFIPIAGYSIVNYIRNTPLKDTYGISSKLLYLTGYSIISSVGNLYHCIS